MFLCQILLGKYEAPTVPQPGEVIVAFQESARKPLKDFDLVLGILFCLAPPVKHMPAFLGRADLR